MSSVALGILTLSWLSSNWEYTGDAAPTPYDASVRRQIQQGFNHMELSFDAFQEAFNDHKRTIDKPLSCIERHYDEFVAFKTSAEGHEHSEPTVLTTQEERIIE